LPQKHPHSVRDVYTANTKAGEEATAILHEGGVAAVLRGWRHRQKVKYRGSGRRKRGHRNALQRIKGAPEASLPSDRDTRRTRRKIATKKLILASGPLKKLSKINSTERKREDLTMKESVPE